MLPPPPRRGSRWGWWEEGGRPPSSSSSSTSPTPMVARDPGWGTTAQRKIVSSNKSALTTVRIKGKDEMRRQSSDQMGRQRDMASLRKMKQFLKSLDD